MEYLVKIAAGTLDGGYGLPNSRGSLKLHGEVAPDGSAYLNVDGVTGSSEYNMGRVGPGMQYHYHVNGKFAGSRGTGTRVEARKCEFTFVKKN